MGRKDQRLKGINNKTIKTRGRSLSTDADDDEYRSSKRRRSVPITSEEIAESNSHNRRRSTRLRSVPTVEYSINNSKEEEQDDYDTDKEIPPLAGVRIFKYYILLYLYTI
jgi:hypothetical protein